MPCVSYARYLGKLFYPVNLSFYPYNGEWKMSRVLLAGLLLFGPLPFGVPRTAEAALFAGRLAVVCGGLWSPVSGLIQVGEQAMADRYMYVCR